MIKSSGTGLNRRALISGDVAAGIVLTGLGIFILTQTQRWAFSNADGPGPGFFPSWYGVAIILLSIALIVGKLRQPSTGERQPIDWRSIARVMLTWGAFCLTVVLLEPLGFAIGFTLLTIVLIRFVFEKSWRAAVVTGVLSSLAFELIFPFALGVQLPVGLVGF
ncbi:tripartite tricarboxylate transporter TctB family protein [Microvirga antarctica]|uniref:tripartite tricarboxylate transporter TctB family protein n=1 Tax=Microvirga antarctica TaxID=2819233 RepID=UPI001B318108|nr:tripartite tricarboxylate transporter TctB family protein [Microvirga antarctica]